MKTQQIMELLARQSRIATDQARLQAETAAINSELLDVIAGQGPPPAGPARRQLQIVSRAA